MNNKYSINRATNALMMSVEEQLMCIHDTKQESLEEIVRYVREFPLEGDYNIAQYGCVLVYYYQVRECYEEAGYKVSRIGDQSLWESYKRVVGRVVRCLVKEHNLHIK